MTDAADNAERSTAASRLAAKRAAKTAAKAARRGTSAVPGAAVLPLREAGHWAGAHRRRLGIGTAAAAVVIAGVIFATTWRDARAHAASAAFQAAVESASAPIVGAGEAPPENAPDETFATAQARAEAALARYRTVSSEHAGTTAANWGLLGEANALLELGKHDEARKVFARVLESGRDDAFIEWRALEGLGFSFEAQGKHDEALRRFEQLASVRKGAYRIVGDYHRARMLVARGKRDKALELLDAAFEADKARAPTDAARFVSVTDAARTLHAEIATALGKPRLHADVAGPSAAPDSTGSGSGVTQQLVDALRRQLAEAKQGARDAGGLTDDIVKALEGQVGQPGTTTSTRVPAAPAPAGSPKGTPP